MSDNGSPMMAGEVEEGLHRLGILHSRTLSGAPHMNGKCEVWWAAIEGRLMAMLEGVEALTLKMLNDATVAWLEREYHRRVHRELGMTPHERLAGSVDASRPCPGLAELKAAFRITRKRTLRRSDGTVSVEGIRYQVPQPWRHLSMPWVRYARWDLGSVDLVDGRSGARLCTLYPLDKRGNADGVRRPTSPGGGDGGGSTGAGELPPAAPGHARRPGRNGPAAGLAAPQRNARSGRGRRPGRCVMNRELLTFYGLKWNPFATDLPVDSLMVSPAVDSFCLRIERHLVRQGGFALIAGEPGTGKSVSLRVLADRLSRSDGLRVCAITHPSSRLSDFYREIGEMFGVDLMYNNRWSSFKNLRERWLAHVDDTRMRPVVLIDEAQELLPSVFSEIRLLASTDFDSRAILSVVLGGDNRLVEKLRQPDLQPIASRIRQRLVMTQADAGDLAALLDHLIEQAGNPGLMTADLKDTLVAHAAGNPRALTVMGDMLLAAGAEKDREVLDEKLFMEILDEPAKPKRARR